MEDYRNKLFLKVNNIHTNCFNRGGKISSRALTPTVECRLSNVVAAAIRTSGRGSLNALLKNYIMFKKCEIIWNLKGNQTFCAYKNIFT